MRDLLQKTLPSWPNLAAASTVVAAPCSEFAVYEGPEEWTEEWIVLPAPYNSIFSRLVAGVSKPSNVAS